MNGTKKENKRTRTRFAPSPTGGLHLGGVRTALYNYLFAKQHQGDFIVRIEDTDQTRFVKGAEEYIFDTLEWCGIEPSESPRHGGQHQPYRQSERKPIYMDYALGLVKEGKAYYAFDTAEALQDERNKNPNFQYNHANRERLNNSIALGETKTNLLLSENHPFVIRYKVTENEKVFLNDMIRGEVVFDTNEVDDKVLIKADGMPTYHLAVVVDDYLMEISHAFRGEEWLPSAPLHVLLWEALFGRDNMPEWAHLPLILKPDGKGKLSKRDGDRLGFPTFPMNWADPSTGEITSGFKERGFLPEAFVNMLAMLGWSQGAEQELFSLSELAEVFNISKVHKGGAKFDFEKAKWFNQEWIKRTDTVKLMPLVSQSLKNEGIIAHEDLLMKVIPLVKDRCQLLNDFVTQAGYFFKAPALSAKISEGTLGYYNENEKNPVANLDIANIKKNWSVEKSQFFRELISMIEKLSSWDASTLETEFKNLAATVSLKPGDLMLPFRMLLVGGKFGPSVFEISYLIGKQGTIERVNRFLNVIEQIG